MTRKRLLKYLDTWGPEHCDPNSWQPVSISALSPAIKQKYLQRKASIDLYLTTDNTLLEITDRTGLSRTEIYRILDRAFDIRKGGGPVGYLACIPGFRIKEYERSVAGSSGKAGRMSQFLEEHPDIKDALIGWALGRKKISQSQVRGRLVKQIWLEFINLCVESGIDLNDTYPFTNKDGGREAVRRYIVKVRERNFEANSKVLFGDEVGKLARTNGTNIPDHRKIPYECAQLDGHLLDGVFNVRIQDAQGDTIDTPLSRIWLLVLIDTSSRCVLGYKLSLSDNYTSDDVLSCIASSLAPWQPKILPTRLSGYTDESGLPSGIIDECAWRVFNTLQMDNAWSHLSEWVQNRIIESGVLEVVTNVPRSPRSNGVVERFMQTFEEVSLHKWPNTTGSNPKDPRRRNPEKAAAKLCIGYEELELIADLAIANYNATPHTSLNGRSPIEYLRYRISLGTDLIRHAPRRNLDGLALYDREFKVTIRSNLSQGHKPYIKFLGVRYSSKILQTRNELNKQGAIFRVNTLDIRTGILFLVTGESIGSVEAESRWLEKPHSVAIRRAVNALVKSRKLQSESRQPVTDYLSFLAEQAPLTRKARNKLLKTQQQTHQEPSYTESSKRKSEKASKSHTYTRKKGWVTLTAAHSRST